ncbi:MAG: hypothetical protein J5855_04215 [Mailhella sp.]|nr:hypothetical protein [Mailhella sp.]
MSDVILSRPAPGVTERMSCEPGDRIVIGFATEDSTVSAQGDDLVFSFDDDGEVLLTDYLKTYTGETAPDLLHQDGWEIDGKDFWNAVFSDDLTPGSGRQLSAFADIASFGAGPAMDAVPAAMAQPEEDPAVLSSMVMMQTFGA